jgi:hypothetical protein
VTGVNPGRHGVLDFTERVPGTYRVRFVNASRRRAPALWSRFDDAGRASAVLTVPGTYPPEPVRGVMVSGWDSPLATAVDGSFVHPRAFHDEIRREVGRIPFADFQEMETGPGLARARAGVAARRRRAADAARAPLPPPLRRRTSSWSSSASRTPSRITSGASTTPRSPRHAPSPFGDAIRRVYRALDDALGALVAELPPDATGRRRVRPRQRRRERPRGAPEPPAARVRAPGLHRRRAAWAAGVAQGGARRRTARRPGRLLRALPAAAGALEASVRFGGIDLAATAAYSEELDYAPSVWINRAGREPEGTVASADYEAMRARVIEALASWRHADGRRSWRACGAARTSCTATPSTQAPDLLLELALVDGYSPSCLRSATPGRRSAAGAARARRRKGAGMNGAHRRDGVIAMAGPGVRAIGDLGACDVSTSSRRSSRRSGPRFRTARRRPVRARP